MSRPIYWIDDSASSMIDIAFTFFPHLWKLTNSNEGIKTHIIIIGNNSQSSPELTFYTKGDEEEFGSKLVNKFKQICVNTRINEELYKRKLPLIKGNAKILYKEGDEDVEEYKKLYNIWHVIHNDTDNNNNEEANSCVNSLYEKLNIPAEACIGIDLLLLNGDREKILGEKESILSMQLYNIFTKHGHKCFLYSRYAFDDSLIEKWRKLYSKNYGNEISAKIYKRKDMFKKSTSYKFIEELFDMAKI